MFKTPFKDAVTGTVGKGSGGDTNSRFLPSEAPRRTGSGEVPEKFYDDITSKKPTQPTPGQSLKVL